MYPFERFTEAAKRTLTVAQQESELMHQGYVGTEHLLIALAGQDATVAGETLGRIGVSEIAVRARVKEVVGSEVRVITTQIIPTSRTKRVVETSFREARAAGSKMVWTDHILLALIDEGEGVAAHVLAELGATMDLVRTTTAQVRAEGIDESRGSASRPSKTGSYPGTLLYGRRPPPMWAQMMMMGAQDEASADMEKEPGEVHLFRHLLVRPEPRIAAALRRLGVDPEQLREAARPPARVLELRRALDAAITDKHESVQREDYPAAEAALQRERRLREDLDEAEASWRKELDDTED